MDALERYGYYLIPWFISLGASLLLIKLLWREAIRRKLATHPGPLIHIVNLVLLNNLPLWQNWAIYMILVLAVALRFSASQYASEIQGSSMVQMWSLVVGWVTAQIVWIIWSTTLIVLYTFEHRPKRLKSLQPRNRLILGFLCLSAVFIAYFGDPTILAYFERLYFAAVSISLAMSLYQTTAVYRHKPVQHTRLTTFVKWMRYLSLTSGWTGYCIKAFFPVPFISIICIALTFIRLKAHAWVGMRQVFGAFFEPLSESAHRSDRFTERLINEGIIPGIAVVFFACICTRLLRFDVERAITVKTLPVNNVVSIPDVEMKDLKPADDKLVDTESCSKPEADAKAFEASSSLEAGKTSLSPPTAPSPRPSPSSIVPPISKDRVGLITGSYPCSYSNLAAFVYVVVHIAFVLTMQRFGVTLRYSANTLNLNAYVSHALVEAVVIPVVFLFAWKRGEAKKLWNFK